MVANFTLHTSQNNSGSNGSRVTLVATGDLIPARSANAQIQRKEDPNWPFGNTMESLKSADITLVNLETPLLKDCPVTEEGFKFCGNSNNISGMVEAGVDIANLANNHLGNYGTLGINETKELLTENRIEYTGTGDVVYKTVKNATFAFLGYNDIGYNQEGISWADKDTIVNEVSLADKNADIVVVSFHWGTEYTQHPTQRQIDLAHFAIDNGADLIIGNHPHWVQSEEEYKGKFIKYAHGNFIFDQMWSEETKRGVIGKYVFEDKKLVEKVFIPVYISDYGQANILTQ